MMVPHYFFRIQQFMKNVHRSSLSAETIYFNNCPLCFKPIGNSRFVQARFIRAGRKKSKMPRNSPAESVRPLVLSSFIDVTNRTSVAPQSLVNVSSALEDLSSFEKDVLIASRIENESLDDGREGQRGNVENIENLSNVELFSGPDPSIPISDTPCGGCGAKLHCQDPGIPGYVPSSTYKSTLPLARVNLKCQRCMLIQKHKLCLNVSVNADEYRRIVLDPLKNITALVILVVDLTDLENSVIPNFAESMGDHWNLYVVGNKIDMIPRDQEKFLSHMRGYLYRNMQKNRINSIKHISVISAKTKFGIEELITEMMADSKKKGDIYIMGNTNVGKSTLYNSLLSSDLCHAKARNFIQRATTSIWPGTTLNLLKFPIFKPSEAELFMRKTRLSKDIDVKSQISHSLIGHVGQTFVAKQEIDLEAEQRKKFDKMLTTAMYTYNEESGSIESNADIHADNSVVVLEPKAFQKSYSCYDTPGVINSSQIINYLTQKELSYLLTVPKFEATTYLLKPNYTMFISGIARIDHGPSEKSVYLTVVTSPKIPVSMVATYKADDYYKEKEFTDTFKIPVDDVTRPKPLPDMKAQTFVIEGIGTHACAADITLSSLGWVGVTAGRASHQYMKVELTVSMPGGLGCGCRSPSLLPNIVQLRGQKDKRHNRFARKEM